MFDSSLWNASLEEKPTPVVQVTVNTLPLHTVRRNQSGRDFMRLSTSLSYNILKK